MKKKSLEFYIELHRVQIAPVIDVLEFLTGKWKIPILMSLSTGDKRFNQIQKELGTICGTTLVRELKYLEEEKFVTWRISDTRPPVAEYSITELGLTLNKVMNELRNWGEANLEKYKVK